MGDNDAEIQCAFVVDFDGVSTTISQTSSLNVVGLLTYILYHVCGTDIFYLPSKTSSRFSDLLIKPSSICL